MIDFLKDILSDEDYEKLVTEISENYVQKNQMEQKINEVKEDFAKNKLDFMLENGLKNSGAKNLVAVKALLEMDKISLLENGEIDGFDEQIKELQKSQDYLFEKTEIKGLRPAEKSSEVAVNPDKMGYKALCEYFKK